MRLWQPGRTFFNKRVLQGLRSSRSAKFRRQPTTGNGALLKPWHDCSVLQQPLLHLPPSKFRTSLPWRKDTQRPDARRSALSPPFPLFCPTARFFIKSFRKENGGSGGKEESPFTKGFPPSPWYNNVPAQKQKRGGTCVPPRRSVPREPDVPPDMEH